MDINRVLPQWMNPELINVLRSSPLALNVGITAITLALTRA